MRRERLIILGSGPAGYTAGIYAARANLKPILLTGIAPGGQMTTTTDVENWPGEPSILGPNLMQNMMDHAVNAGVEIVYDTISSANLWHKAVRDAEANGPFLLQGDSDSYNCDALIIATGATAQYLGLESEQKFIGRGVSACATCDGFFYKDQDVIVVGGGNTAVEEALYLSNIAKNVRLLHRRDTLRAEKVLQERLFAKPNIEICWNTELEQVLGDDSGVNGAVLRDNTGKEKDLIVSVHGIFIAIGHKPNTEIFDRQLTLDDGYIVDNWDPELGATSTSIPGVFAAGDVADMSYRQAITAAGSGCQAALDAERYLDSKS